MASGERRLETPTIEPDLPSRMLGLVHLDRTLRPGVAPHVDVPDEVYARYVKSLL